MEYAGPLGIPLLLLCLPRRERRFKNRAKSLQLGDRNMMAIRKQGPSIEDEVTAINRALHSIGPREPDVTPCLKMSYRRSEASFEIRSRQEGWVIEWMAEGN